MNDCAWFYIILDAFFKQIDMIFLIVYWFIIYYLILLVALLITLTMHDQTNLFTLQGQKKIGVLKSS